MQKTQHSEAGHGRLFYLGAFMASVLAALFFVYECMADDEFIFDGVSYDYIVDLPKESEGSPLVIMLHGYGSSAAVFRSETAFHEKACPRGYTVVYLTGASDPGDRTSAAGWNYRALPEGNRDPDLLRALAAYLEGKYGTDPDLCFAVGFSNGAFLCHRLALEASDLFTACVSVGGFMAKELWESRPESMEPSFFQISGEKDNVIPKESDGSARYTKDPAIENVIGYYVSEPELDKVEKITVGNASILTKYSFDSSDKIVWDLIVKDGRHSWSAGSITGIDTNELILEFLDEISTS